MAINFFLIMAEQLTCLRSDIGSIHVITVKYAFMPEYTMETIEYTKSRY